MIKQPIAFSILPCMALLAIATAALAQTPPASAPATEHLKATITAIEGNVRYRVGSQPWMKCAVGLILDEGAEFRTDPDSSVQFTLPPDQTITVGSMTKVKLVDAIKSNGKIDTDVGLKHGSVRLEINAAGVEHQSTIRSPNSTLAVSGTVVSLTDERPFPPVASSLTGRARFATAKAKTAFGNKGAGKLTVTGDHPNAADQLLDSSVIDPSIALARTPEDRLLLANVISLGGIVNFGNDRQIPVVSDLTPPTDAQLKPFIVGQLDFILRWNSNANLDLTIGDQQNEVLFPHTGNNTTRSGGFIPFDDQGGPRGGLELAYWQNSFPASFYDIEVSNVSGAATMFTLEIFEHGKLLNPPTTVTSGNSLPTGPTKLYAGDHNPYVINLTGAPGSFTPLSTAQSSKPKQAGSTRIESPPAERTSTPAVAVVQNAGGSELRHR
jgi:hypothetical protein